MKIDDYLKMGLFRLLAYLPFSWYPPMARFLGRLGYFFHERGPFKGYFHRAVSRALKVSAKEAECIVRANFEHMGRMLFEIAASRRLGARWTEFFSISGRESFDRSFQTGKGVILLSGHVGNFELLIQILPLIGIPATVIGWRQPDTLENRYLDRLRQQFGTGLIYSQEVKTKEATDMLCEGSVLLMVADHYNLGRNTVPFFGIPTPIAAGPVHYAVKSGAAVVPVWITRVGGRHQVHFEAAIEIPDGDDPYVNGLEACVRWYEQWIHDAPEQFLWILRREDWGTPS